MAFVYRTATTLKGVLADPEHSLAWLFAVPPRDNLTLLSEFQARVGALVMGSHTYEWLLEHERLLEDPGRWPLLFGVRPVFVFSSRELPLPQGAALRVLSGPVANHLPDLRRAAGAGDVWIQGGGDLAGQFLDAGALDELVLDVAPAALAQGAPLLPRTVAWPRLRLQEARQVGEFALLRWTVNG